MLILGIESSCDETAAALIENGTHIVSHVKATTLNANRAFGGVVPDKTAREQLKLILPIINQALGNVPWGKIDALAVTYGPGLIGSLLVGVETAKALAFSLNKPIIPVNHLVGHIYACWLTSSTVKLDFPLPAKSPTLPALALIASGAHCDLVLVKDHNFELLGSTRDDAAGECFDKCGRLLELEYPYGPYIEPEAVKFNSVMHPQTIHLPRPLLAQQNLDFSFSGLKTAFLYEFQRLKDSSKLTDILKAELAYELQEAVTDVLCYKFIAAALKYKINSLILTGGVAANKRLREKVSLAVSKSLPHAQLYIPPIALCTDNATYIASAAFFNQNFVTWNKIQANPGLNFASAI